MANAYRAYRTIERRRCRQIMVGAVPVGGDAPISVQTMTNTLTTDVAGTLAQIEAAAKADAAQSQWFKAPQIGYDAPLHHRLHMESARGGGS